MFKVNDFFCGAGGMGLGFKQAGFRLEGAWDFDKYAVESYGNNVSPKVKKMDIKEMTKDDVPNAEVWTFGFPCQDLSVLGRRAGMIKGETRSGLFFEIMRLLEETESTEPSELPLILLAENVKPLKTYLPDLESEYKARGYKMYYTLFNTLNWGVAQNRERYFVIGVHKNIDKPFIFPTEKVLVDTPKIESVLENNVAEKFYIHDDRAEKILKETKAHRRFLTSLAWRSREFKQFGFREEAHTLFARDYKDPQNLWDFQEKTVRKLTPREYARLQNFPEDYEQLVSNTQFYKQMGNAVTVSVAKAIAEKINEFLS